LCGTHYNFIAPSLTRDKFGWEATAIQFYDDDDYYGMINTARTGLFIQQPRKLYSLGILISEEHS